MALSLPEVTERHRESRRGSDAVPQLRTRHRVARHATRDRVGDPLPYTTARPTAKQGKERRRIESEKFPGATGHLCKRSEATVAHAAGRQSTQDRPITSGITGARNFRQVVL